MDTFLGGVVGGFVAAMVMQLLCFPWLLKRAYRRGRRDKGNEMADGNWCSGYDN